MKKLFAVIALSAAFVASAQAQSGLGNLLGGLLGGGNTSSPTTTSTSSADGGAIQQTIGNVLGGLLGTVYTAAPTLNGTYAYKGIAVSMTSSEGNVLTNLAGTAATTQIENKINEILAKFGIKEGNMTITFDNKDNTFVWTVGGFPLNGTYKVGDGEKTITMTFGRTMQYFCMTGTVDFAGLDGGVKLLFTSDKMTAFLKKAIEKLGQKNNEIGTIAKLAQGYDNYKIGVNLAKQQ